MCQRLKFVILHYLKYHFRGFFHIQDAAEADLLIIAGIQAKLNKIHQLCGEIVEINPLLLFRLKNLKFLLGKV